MSHSMKLATPLLAAAALAASALIAGCTTADDAEVQVGETTQAMST